MANFNKVLLMGNLTRDIQMTYLPSNQTAVADFDVLGIEMRGFHDFGVGLQDARGGVKVKGEA